jgi:hypothetical protein
MVTKSKKLTPEQRIVEIKRRLKANAKLAEKLKMLPGRRRRKKAT